MNNTEKIALAQKVFDDEIAVLDSIKKSLGEVFVEFEEAIISCKGKVVLCGMGKSGHIARKISATLSSLGTPSFFLHPAEAMHGDLGMISEDDVIILISNSGETAEIIHLLPSLKAIGVKLLAITGNIKSTLAQSCDIVQILKVDKEACMLNLAPTSSTTAALVFGDALAVAASVDTGFGASDFGLYHPAGTLGKKVLTKVSDIMVKEEAIPVVKSGCIITEAIMEMSHKGLGVIAVVDADKSLTGILTDGDLRRAIEKKADLYHDIIDTIMTKEPKVIKSDILAVDALKMLKESNLNNYPIVDDSGRIIGMLTWQMIIKRGIIL